jgi:hypothetical protein
MSDGEQKTNPYASSIHGDGRGLGFSLAFGVLFVACVAGVLLSIAVSGHAVLKILETTPFMAIMVDARGKPIPIQGYPQLGFGLAGALLFSVLAVALGLHWAGKRNASDRRTNGCTRGGDRVG